MIQINKKLLLSICAIVLVIVTALTTVLIVGIDKDNNVDIKNETEIAETIGNTEGSTETPETEKGPSDATSTNSAETSTNKDENSNQTTNSTNSSSTQQTTDSNSRPVVSTDSTNKKNDKPNSTSSSTTTNTTTSSTTNSTTVKDNTVFDSYAAFASSISSDNYTSAKAPNLSNIKTSCKCGIKLSGDIDNGSITIASLNHGHTWSTNISLGMQGYPDYNGNSGITPYSSDKIDSVNNGKSSSTGVLNSQTGGSAGVANPQTGGSATSSGVTETIFSACKTCGFIKGDNFIFIKLPNADHGHGWSWPIADKEILQKKEKYTWKQCTCTLYGNFDEGFVRFSVFSKKNDKIVEKHTHRWGINSSESAPISSLIGALQDYVNNNHKNSGVSDTIEKNTSYAEALKEYQEAAKEASKSSASKQEAISGSTSAGGSASPRPNPGVSICSTCGFKRYIANNGQKVIMFNCPTTNKQHIVKW